ncbi:MAG: hypothetical protein FJ387_27275 [Verrucomicrobia bacterium]|nr:hypothetical protein [Verrucomicrobiota bacterium]
MTACDQCGIARRVQPPWVAQLYAGTSQDESTLVAMGTRRPFRTGGFAGYFEAGEVAVTGITTAGPAWVQVRAWDSTRGQTYENAAAAGSEFAAKSIVLFLPRTADPTAEPPEMPVYLVGLNMPPCPPPAVLFTRQPENVTVLAGSECAIGFAADCLEGWNIRWTKDGVELPWGVSELRFSSVKDSDAGTYGAVLEWPADPSKRVETKKAVLTVVGNGLVWFSNKSRADRIDEPVTLCDRCGIPYSVQAPWVAQLYGGTTQDDGTLAPMGSRRLFGTGVLAGYFEAGTVAVTGIRTAGPACVQLRAWDSTKGETYEIAAAAGSDFAQKSVVLCLARTADPTAVPPETPVPLVGLKMYKAPRCEPPPLLFSREPENVTVLAGSECAIGFAADCLEGWNIRWTKDGVELPWGVSELRFSSVKDSDAGTYGAVLEWTADPSKRVETKKAVLTVVGNGLVWFSNKSLAFGIDEPVTLCDDCGIPYGVEPPWVAQLYAGTSTNEDLLTPVETAQPFYSGPWGYVTPATVRILGIASGGPACVQLRAWDSSKGKTYEKAVAAGSDFAQKSVVLSLSRTGDPTTQPSEMPVPLVGLKIIHPSPRCTPPPMVFSSQPQSLTVRAGTTCAFRFSAACLEGWSIQWTKNGQELPGERFLILPIISATEADAGSYAAVLLWKADPSFRTNTQPAVLTVVQKWPPLTVQGEVVPPGVFVVRFSSAVDQRYALQWRDSLSDGGWNGGDVWGLGNGRTLVLVDPTPAVGRRFYRVVSP